MENSVYCVIPNLNGKESIGACLDSLLNQSLKPKVIVVENNSDDGSFEFIQKHYPDVEILPQGKNLGFAGGVNVGITKALEYGAEYVGLLNNDAVADKDWLQYLTKVLKDNPKVGIAACKLLDSQKKYIDSTGDLYTSWGLPFPRGRGEKVSNKYDTERFIFGASGGASLYRVKMFKDIGLFDNDFFAYYEDVELSFRAQLKGWKIYYEPQAMAYHSMGATSSKIKGFTTYQTMKNLPFIVWKDVPASLLPIIVPRLGLAYTAFYLSALQRGDGWPATKGILRSIILFPKKIVQRLSIQNNRTVPVDYIRSIITYDLPANASKLMAVREKWRKLMGRSTA